MQSRMSYVAEVNRRIDSDTSARQRLRAGWTTEGMTETHFSSRLPAAAGLTLQLVPQLGNIGGFDRMRRIAPNIAGVSEDICNLLVAEVPAEGRHRRGGWSG